MAEIINMPKLGFDMAEGTLVRWVRNEGDTINKGDVLAEIETDKATVEVESSASGTVLKLLSDEGDIVPINAPIAVIGEPGEEFSDQLSVRSEQPPMESAQVPEGSEQSSVSSEQVAVSNEPLPVGGETPEIGRVKASPLAKRIARDKKVDLGAIVGTGPGGRIVRRDIEEALAGGQPTAVMDKTPPAASIPSFTAVSHADETVKLTRLRQAIGRRLVESKQNMPHFYVTREFKMDALMEMRKHVNGMLPEGEKLSVNDFIVKGAALALRQFPNLNARLEGDAVLRHGHVNVSVAVTVEGGLLTVVVKDADQKSLRQISMEVKEMAARVREGKIKPDDVDGSTFSTSNLGMYDVDEFIAIINPPEAAILAIGSAMQVPVVEEGEIVPGWRMKATISVDHRVSDGAEAARFMGALATFLEEPLRLMI